MYGRLFPTFGRRAAPAAQAAAAAQGFVPEGGTSHDAPITDTTLTLLDPQAGSLTPVAYQTVGEATELFLRPGQPVRPFLMGYEDIAFVQAAAVNLTLTAGPIVTTRQTITLPASGLFDLRVFVQAGPDGIGTELPVTVFADATKQITVDASGLATAGGNYTARVYYLPDGGQVVAQVAAPSGAGSRVKPVLSMGTRTAFTKDPIANLGYVTLKQIGGYGNIKLPQNWEFQLVAKYPTTPTLTYSDLSFPARLVLGSYSSPNGSALETSDALRRLGLSS